LPFLATIGTGAYDLLHRGEAVDCMLAADLAGSAGPAGFGTFELPPERSGRAELSR